MTAMTLSAALVFIVFVLLVLGALALASFLIWVIFFTWRHITASGQEDRLDTLQDNLNDVGDRLDALEEAKLGTDKMPEPRFQ